MLSSLTRHFNESVFRGPDTEGAGGNVEDAGNLSGDVGGGAGDVDSGTGGGEVDSDPQEKLTVREQIKKSWAEASEPAAKPKPKAGRFGERPAKGQEAASAEVTPEKPAAPAVAAPASLPKEAAAEWEKTPPAIQAAFVKREADMAKGVEELKGRYALIDQAIAPHNDALRQMNATPGEAVNRMFLWFKALAGNPVNSFPELAKSMGINWDQLVAARSDNTSQQPQQPQQPQGTAAGGAPEIPEPLKNYVGNLERQVAQLGQFVQQNIQQLGGRFGSIEQNLNSQNEARTRENLSIWSKGKDYFEEVRQDMAKLIETGIVPLKDGQVDLDTAYERAIYLNPEVRAKVLAAQQQANQQVQQTAAAATTAANQSQVNRARKASVSLPSASTPGAGNTGNAAAKKPGQRLSVRDSLKAALTELRDQ